MLGSKAGKKNAKSYILDTSEVVEHLLQIWHSYTMLKKEQRLYCAMLENRKTKGYVLII